VIEDTPITEEAFKKEIEAGRELINNKCPVCDKMIVKNTRLLKGYGENVTKMVRTGYNEYTFKTTYEGTYDQNVVTYTCGCEGVNYSLVEYEKDGMYCKKYTTTSNDDWLKKVCAFSEIHSSKKTWYNFK
jgi:hypothetical protein